MTLLLLATLGIGLLPSTFSRTQQQAFALNCLLVLALFILSGFAFPVSAIPAVLRWLTCLNPLRHFLGVLRAGFLKGVGIQVLWPQLAAMAILGVTLMGLSILRVRKSLH